MVNIFCERGWHSGCEAKDCECDCHGKLKGRILRRLDFFRENEALCIAAFQYGIGHNIEMRGHKEAREFIEKARETLKFSKLTYDGDIFYTEKDELYDKAKKIIIETRVASVSNLQRRLNIGYARGARIINQLQRDKFISEYGQGAKPLEIYDN